MDTNFISVKDFKAELFFVKPSWVNNSLPRKSLDMEELSPLNDETSKVPIDDLPDDMLFEIFRNFYCPFINKDACVDPMKFEQLFILSLVCKRFRKLIRVRFPTLPNRLRVSEFGYNINLLSFIIEKCYYDKPKLLLLTLEKGGLEEMKFLLSHKICDKILNENAIIPHITERIICEEILIRTAKNRKYDIQYYFKYKIEKISNIRKERRLRERGLQFIKERKELFT
jgi:hypothetical protein